MDKNLYQQLILEHNKSPKNFGKPESFTHFAEGVNPMCGDEYHIWVELDSASQIIKGVWFDGQGCAISKASASLMTSQLKGKTLEQASELFKRFRDMCKQGDDKAEELGKLQIFSGIYQYPARVKCAILAWHAFNGAVENNTTVTTE